MGKWTALDTCPSEALEVLLPLGVSLLNLEVSLLNLELTLLNLKVTHNSLEVTLLALEAIRHSLGAIHLKLEAILLHQVAINLHLWVTLASQEAILPNMVTIPKWSNSREGIQCSQEHIQGRLQATHHLHLVTLIPVKFQQQLLQPEQQG